MRRAHMRTKGRAPTTKEHCLPWGIITLRYPRHSRVVLAGILNSIIRCVSIALYTAKP